MHTGDISWDDTFQFQSTLYRAQDGDAQEGSFDRKDFSVAFLEYNHLKKSSPRVLCKGRLNIADFASDNGTEFRTQCHLNDKTNTPLATLTLLIKGRWTGDVRGQRGAATRIKVAEEGVDEADESDGGSSCSLSTRITRSTAASRPGAASALNPPALAGARSSWSSHSASGASDSMLPPLGTASTLSEHPGFRPSLKKIESVDELTQLASRSPGGQSQTDQDDAEVLDFAISRLEGPSRFTASGLPLGSLLVARYALELRSARFGLALSQALRGLPRKVRGDLEQIAYRVAFSAVLQAILRCQEIKDRRAHPIALPELPGGNQQRWARHSEHGRQVTVSMGADAHRHLVAMLDMFCRRLFALLSPSLAAAFIETGISTPGKSSVDAARPSSAQQSVTADLSRGMDALFAARVPRVLVVHVVSRIFTFIDAQLFNTLVERWDLCTPTNGVQIKLSLSLLDEWLETVGGAAGEFGRAEAEPRRSTSPVSGHRGFSQMAGTLCHIRQAADVLIINRSSLSSPMDILEVCPALEPAHVQTLQMWCEHAARARAGALADTLAPSQVGVQRQGGLRRRRRARRWHRPKSPNAVPSESLWPPSPCARPSREVYPGLAPRRTRHPRPRGQSALSFSRRLPHGALPSGSGVSRVRRRRHGVCGRR